ASGSYVNKINWTGKYLGLQRRRTLSSQDIVRQAKPAAALGKGKLRFAPLPPAPSLFLVHRAEDFDRECRHPQSRVGQVYPQLHWPRGKGIFGDDQIEF